MGEAEIVDSNLLIRSHIITYGRSAGEEITQRICEEIQTMWNEPEAYLWRNGRPYRVRFLITGETEPDIPELKVLMNTDPRNNYFRIEEFVHGDVSFVDAIGCNTGYFKLQNLHGGSTTAAHEYGHTLGLRHPRELDIRGQGTPGIMYPRGTWVDPSFQYDPAALPGRDGGTLQPVHRRVLPSDIMHLRLHRLRFREGRAILGEFTNMYHWSHREGPAKNG